MAETQENGFLTPVYDALVERQLMAGVPRTFGIMVWVICGSLALFQSAWFMLLAGIVVHYIMAFFVRKDPWFFETLKLSRRYPEYFRE